MKSNDISPVQHYMDDTFVPLHIISILQKPSKTSKITFAIFLPSGVEAGGFNLINSRLAVTTY